MMSTSLDGGSISPMARNALAKAAPDLDIWYKGEEKNMKRLEFGVLKLHTIRIGRRLSPFLQRLKKWPHSSGGLLLLTLVSVSRTAGTQA